MTPTRVRYNVNDTFDPSGMVIQSVARDGTKTIIEDYTCDVEDLTEVGEKTVSITHGTFTDSFKIKVVEAENVNPNTVSRVKQDEIKNKYFKKESHTYNGMTLSYRKYLPTDSPLEKLPLVIMLHGAGERGSDNLSQLLNSFWRPFTRSDSLFLDACIIAPQCPPEPYKWVQLEWASGTYSTDNIPESEPIKVVYDLIQQFINEPFIDSRRVYVTGLSMGGYGTWDLLSRHPETFAAGLPICGGGDPNKANVLADIPILTFHGTADDVVPFRGTNSMYNIISMLGKNNIEFIKFEGAGHAIWNEAFDYQKVPGEYYFEQFMFSKYKNL